MKLGEIVNIYNVFGEARMASLDVKDVVRAIKIRKTLRPYVEEWNEFFKDMQGKASEMSDEQKKELNRIMENEWLKEVEVEVEKLDEESIAKLIQENGFKIRDIDLLDVIMK